MKIGKNLKNIRIERGYKLKDVSERLSLTSSHISQIENNKIFPSLHALEELLAFYSIKLSDFFTQVEQQKYIIQKKNDIETFKDEKTGVTIHLLASKLQSNVMETYIIELDSRSSIDIKKLSIDNNGERLLYLFSGSISILIDGVDYLLEEGDSLNFKAYIMCKISKKSKGKTVVLLSGTPPVLW